MERYFTTVALLGVNDGNRIVLSPASTGNETALDQAMDTAKDVIDRRINALGTLEPTIIRQGENRIVVQVPGLQDPKALKDLLGKTARRSASSLRWHVSSRRSLNGGDTASEPGALSLNCFA